MAEVLHMADEFKGDPDNLKSLLAGLLAGTVDGSVDRQILRVATAAIKQLQSLYETSILEKRLREIERHLESG